MTEVPRRRWLTIREAADYLGLHPKTCYVMAGKGILPAARIGGTIRVDLLKLDEFLERQIQKGER